jgi:hypothetical protein
MPLGKILQANRNLMQAGIMSSSLGTCSHWIIFRRKKPPDAPVSEIAIWRETVSEQDRASGG